MIKEYESYNTTLIRMFDSLRTSDGNKGMPNCNGVPCEKCPLEHIKACNKSRTVVALDKAQQVADAVAQWGKEHPVKTNRDAFVEALQKTFGDIVDIDKIMDMLDVEGCNILKAECTPGVDCADCAQDKFLDKEYKKYKR